MAKTLIGALALALASLPSALAFSNTSPFFLVSTADLHLEGADVELAQASTIATQVAGAIKDCPTRSYFVVRQDGVSSADYPAGLAARHRDFLHSSSHESKSTIEVPEVVGTVDTDAISQYLQTQCNAKVVKLKIEDYATEPLSEDASPHVYEIALKGPGKGRSLDLRSSDDFINHAISRYSSPAEGYTIIYTTTPATKEQVEASQHAYEMEDPFGDAVQMELKRDIASHRRAGNDNAQKEGGLFERYQYLSPGLFMGLSATVPLFLILVVGLKALSGLEVSYFAFSKEMGPTAQRKQ